MKEKEQVRRWLVLGMIGALLAAGCGTDDSSGTADDGSIQVVAPFYPVAAAAQRVGGSCVTVENLTPAGAEPHDLELTPDQIDSIQDAAVVFVLGEGFQPGLEDAAAQRDGTTVALLDQLKLEGAGASDPHVWLDPVLYSEVVDAIARSLTSAAPACREQITRNAAELRAEIDRVNDRYTDGLRDCDRRTIVTAHDAFGHLARRYQLDQVGIAGISPEEEPTAPRMADLADRVRREGITTIFTEELVSPRVAEALAREAGGVKVATLNPLEGLSESQLDRGEDWASVMGENLDRLRTALGCR
jgi:zinc transport system substrate-binding protein